MSKKLESKRQKAKSKKQKGKNKKQKAKKPRSMMFFHPSWTHKIYKKDFLTQAKFPFL